MEQFKEIDVDGVTQRFRWIEPGHFLMGSPADEPDRYNDEAQHEVTLSRGYWLADTACTKAFWQAVMGYNPGHFNDYAHNNPVTNVSWNDVQRFIGELQRRVAGLAVRLPSEAEWEYACRAGTTTPFSFGKDITTEQVNYNGDHPYAGGALGLYRQWSVPVKTFPANAWGLYEMHGNVWEWCADLYGAYPSKPQIDPQGPPSGRSRVVRGGSWHNHGRDVRSSSRCMNTLHRRHDTVGFRLATDGDRQ